MSAFSLPKLPWRSLQSVLRFRISGDLLAQYRRCVDDISRQLLPVATPLIAKALAARPKEPLSNGVDSTSAPSQTR